MTARRLARRAATVLVVGAGVVFVGLAIQSNWSRIGSYDWRVRWAQAAASVLLLTLSLMWSVFVWKRVLDRFQAPPITFRLLLKISFLSKMARYIPGKVWQFIAVGQLSRETGAPPAVMVTSMLVHAGIVVLSAVFAAAILIVQQVEVLAARPVPAVIGLAVLSLGAAHPSVINVCLKALARVARQETLRWHGRWPDSVEVFFLSFLSWVADGVAFFLFVDALLPVATQYLVPFIGIHAFAFVIGYVAFVAPAGAGVREAALATLLRGALPSGAAAVIAVFARLWTITAELLGAVIVLLIPTDRHQV